jgi:hypothetical protein
MSLSRNRGFVIGPLVVALARSTTGGDVVEPATTWANGLLHRGWSFRLTPWRRSAHEARYLLPGPSLVLAWRL